MQPWHLKEIHTATEGRLLLGFLGTVLGTGLLAVRDALGIQDTSDNVVAHTGQVADTTASDEDNRVFLQVVAFAGDVGRDFDAIGKANTGHFTEGRVRLLGGHRFDLQAHASLGGVALHGRMLRLGPLHRAWLLDELINRRHVESFRLRVLGTEWDVSEYRFAVK
jgi:hypothetical protein